MDTTKLKAARDAYYAAVRGVPSDFAVTLLSAIDEHIAQDGDGSGSSADTSSLEVKIATLQKDKETVQASVESFAAQVQEQSAEIASLKQKLAAATPATK